jgi:hypothetical protein
MQKQPTNFDETFDYIIDEYENDARFDNRFNDLTEGRMRHEAERGIWTSGDSKYDGIGS